MLPFKQTLWCFLSKKIHFSLSTSVCLIRFAKHFLRSPFVKNTLLAIEKCQEIKVKGEKSEFKYERNNGLQKLYPIITRK